MIMDLIMLSVIVCFIIDISGFIESIEMIVGKWLGGKVKIPKPFSCSLCMCFWCGLIYLFVVGSFNIFGMMLVCVIAALSENITNLIAITKMCVSFITDKIISIITNK